MKPMVVNMSFYEWEGGLEKLHLRRLSDDAQGHNVRQVGAAQPAAGVP
jgi:hypothetical protein